jgi:outer membrane protein OmpA-like peptidoglycan-associated protein
MKRYKKTSLVINAILLVSVLLIFSISGCATVPEKNVALENARALYEQAQANPEVTGNAPVALHEAGLALNQAEEAKSIQEKEHFAYLAEKKTNIAIQQAEQKKAEKEWERLSKEEDKIVLEAREQEIKNVKRVADLLAKQAEIAQKEAQAKAIEIERAKGKAEAKALEAEQARKEAEVRALELERARQEAEARAIQAEMEKLQKDQVMEAKKQLERELEELRAQKTDRGSVLTLGDILFEVDKADLLPGAMRTIDKLAEFLKNHPERNIIIEGHTDDTGSATYNLGLSQRRADGVRGALLQRGIASERIVTKGYGQQFPVASNATSAGRQQNRRVEIIILDEGASPEKMLR